MAEVGKLMQVPAGTTILSEGELNLDMYKIVKGNAEVYMEYGTERETLIGIIGPQACFGELGLLIGKPAINTVIAYSDVLLLRITKGEIGDFVQENHKSIIGIMENMAYTMLKMRTQIDMLINDVNEGKKLDERQIHDIQKIIRSVMLPQKDSMSGEFHTLDLVRRL